MLDTYSLSNISCLITKAWTAKIRPRDPHWKKKYRILLIKLTLSEIRNKKMNRKYKMKLIYIRNLWASERTKIHLNKINSNLIQQSKTS